MTIPKYKTFFRKSIYSILIANAVLVGGVDTILNGVHQAVSERITNQSELETMVEVERKKAGILEGVKINASLGDQSCSEKIDEDSYRLSLNKDGIHNSLATLRHELYHIARGHCDSLYPPSSRDSSLKRLRNAVKYLLINEPQAIIYSATGIKL